MSSKPAIILVTPGFPKDEADTSCLPAFQQFALSVQHQFPMYQLLIVSFQYPFEAKTYYWQGLQVHALGGQNRGGLLRLRTWYKAYRRLRQLGKQYQLKGLISLWITECALVANRFALRHKLRHLTWIIGQDAKAGNKYVRHMKPEASQLVAMSDFLRDEFYRNYHILPQQVVENGIRESIFSALNQGPRPIDILGAGSLIPLKNYGLFLELIAEVKALYPALKAQLAGGGEEQENLQALIKHLGLEDTVTLLGPRSHPETLWLMSQSKVFLHTSVYEGNSTVLMEGLYSGCRVISTCALSHRPTENLVVETDRARLKEQLLVALSGSRVPVKRIVFNTMDRSAQRIVHLLEQ